MGGVPLRSNELVALMVRELPTAFVVALQQAMPHIYQEAHEQAFKQPLWGASEGRYLIGHVRHALFEAQFRKAADSTGLKTGLAKVPVGNYEYSFVRAGKLFLTGSGVPSSDEMPRPADFREQNAQVNSFLVNPPLSIIEPPDLTRVDTIYGIVIHAPYESDKAQCSYVGIGIPNQDTTEWVELLSLADLSRAQLEATQAKPEDAADQAFPRKREKKAEGTGQEDEE